MFFCEIPSNPFADELKKGRNEAFRLSVEGISLLQPGQLLPLPPDVQPVGDHRLADLQVLREILHSKVSLFLRILEWPGQSDNPCSGAQLSQGRINTIKVLKHFCIYFKSEDDIIYFCSNLATITKKF